MSDTTPSPAPTILVIDDDRQITKLLTLVFEQHGYPVLACHSGTELYRLWADSTGVGRTNIGAILLDLNLPGTNTEEVYDFLRADADAAERPIIVLSAMSNIERRVAWLERGVDDYLVKPYPLDEMVARVQIHIKLRHSRQAQKKAEAQATIRAHYLRAINEVSHVASQYLDLDLMLQQAGVAIFTQFASLSCRIYLVDVVREEEEVLRLVHTSPAPTTDESRSLIPPLVHEARTYQHSRRDGHQMAVPIQRGMILLGVLWVVLPSTQEWLNETAEALETLAIQLATAVTNAYLFQDIRSHNQQLKRVVQENSRLLRIETQQRRQAEQLHRMSQLISSSLELSAVLAAAMDNLRTMIDVERGSILLLDENSGQLRFAKTLNNLPENSLQELRIDRDTGIVGRVLREKQPITENNVQTSPYFSPAVDKMTGLKTQSILCVPLVAHDQIIGAIELINKQQGKFNELDERLAVSAATSIAIAIDNARLHEEQAALLQERALAQQQLVQSEKLAAAGRLAASLAHEINNPLQAIHSCLQLLLTFNLSEEKKKEYLLMASEEVERLVSITSRILEFARPSTGGTDTVTVSQLVTQVLQLAQKYIAHQKVKLQQFAEPNLPSVDVIPDQIAQVFLNIILNGIDATPPQGVLNVVSQREGEWVKVSFIDSGPGMAAEVQERVFEPFFSTKEGHAGLGLTISYGIVERHGGRIDVTSVAGQGCTFSVYLPISTKVIEKKSTRPFAPRALPS